MKVVVLGASDNPARYSYMAMISLLSHGFDAIPVGIKKTDIDHIPIIQSKKPLPGIHTITVYLNPIRQKEWYEFILKTNPQRIIFNPGTENLELIQLVLDKHIEVVEACTLVLLSTGQFAQTI
ncbi:MAG: CoA-binding protein [Bacteroidetes bacterium]|nr:CoA-binding protein [Bacteroidota bacterium]